MKKRVAKLSIRFINYMIALPLLALLLFTNQNKEMSKLLMVLKTSTEF
ncbi:hypothetical protein JBL43_11520 [Aureibaculum sp. A20]|uniref:Uncharacterized protein n=1 Tax=Aureibaculum flavum TaxID=2795986 RepID=A0ABS0WSA5_9FLAO|nr:MULTISPECIES: hypothetical protein [Aureibaculum]MBJ2174869.1 hypothetical protein [Aureibaculum flavum]